MPLATTVSVTAPSTEPVRHTEPPPRKLSASVARPCDPSIEPCPPCCPNVITFDPRTAQLVVATAPQAAFVPRPPLGFAQPVNGGTPDDEGIGTGTIVLAGAAIAAAAGVAWYLYRRR